MLRNLVISVRNLLLPVILVGGIVSAGFEYYMQRPFLLADWLPWIGALAVVLSLFVLRQRRADPPAPASEGGTVDPEEMLTKHAILGQGPGIDISGGGGGGA